MLTNILVYTGIGIIILGCLILFFGAGNILIHKSKMQTDYEREEAKLRLRHYRLAWMLLSILGIDIVFIASLLS